VFYSLELPSSHSPSVRHFLFHSLQLRQFPLFNKNASHFFNHFETVTIPQCSFVTPTHVITASLPGPFGLHPPRFASVVFNSLQVKGFIFASSSSTSLMESQAISAGLPVVPFAIPCLAVLGTSHEDTCLTPGVLRNWKQQQQSTCITHQQRKITQNRMSALSFAESALALHHTSVLKPRSFPSPIESKIKFFDSKFLAACEFTSHTSHVTPRHTSHVTRHTSHVPRHTSLSPQAIHVSDLHLDRRCDLCGKRGTRDLVPPHHPFFYKDHVTFLLPQFVSSRFHSPYTTSHSSLSSSLPQSPHSRKVSGASSRPPAAFGVEHAVSSGNAEASLPKSPESVTVNVGGSASTSAAVVQAMAVAITPTHAGDDIDVYIEHAASHSSSSSPQSRPLPLDIPSSPLPETRSHQYTTAAGAAHVGGAFGQTPQQQEYASTAQSVAAAAAAAAAAASESSGFSPPISKSPSNDVDAFLALEELRFTLGLSQPTTNNQQPTTNNQQQHTC
jgi:hypothetical protein